MSSCRLAGLDWASCSDGNGMMHGYLGQWEMASLWGRGTDMGQRTGQDARIGRCFGARWVRAARRDKKKEDCGNRARTMGVEGSVAEQQGQGWTSGTDGLRAQGRAEQAGRSLPGSNLLAEPTLSLLATSTQIPPVLTCLLLPTYPTGLPRQQLPTSPVATLLLTGFHPLPGAHQPLAPPRLLTSSLGASTLPAHPAAPTAAPRCPPPPPWHPPPPAGPQVPPTHPQPVPTCPLAAGGGHDAGREGLREGLHAPILDLDGEVGLHAVVGSGGGGGGRTGAGAGAGADGARACGRLGRALLCASAAAAAPRVLSDPRRRGRARSPL